MKWLSAGVTFVNFSTACGLILGMVGGGLTFSIAAISVIFGAAIAAYLIASDSSKSDVLESSKAEANIFPDTRWQQPGAADVVSQHSSFVKYRDAWKWILAAFFAIFAFRAFCWLIYIDSEELKIQSPNNLGDLALHITYIRNFANGVSLWPDNPIYVFSKLRYPAGIDLFNALLCCLHVDLTRGLVWTGLLGSLATFYAFYRWGGSFAVAGFLFNGGIAGFQILRSSTFLKFLDYQGDKAIAWKSIPLAMFVTQRGLLYAIPAGLLLLWHWRDKFYGAENRKDRHHPPLPFWVELSIYASMPLFHVHTFLALSAVLVCLFLGGDPPMRRHIAILIAGAFVPATFFVWLISDNFHAASMLDWNPGWVMHDPELGRPTIFQFWFTNFGIFIPLALCLLAICCWRLWKFGINRNEKLPEKIAFLLPAAAIFISGLLFKFAPWEWDNLKLMIWAYFLVLPFLWTDLIARWPLEARVAVCIGLFASGFVSLFGGLASGRTGFGFANRAELDEVGAAIQNVPVEARFAAYPLYNHPLLLQGRKVVMGYPGHLWTQGFDYAGTENQLRQLMEGAGNWRETARDLHARYLFWGREEQSNYPTSKRPWEKTAWLVASGDWGAIYDLEQPPRPSAAR
ncbi:MAG: hypothetical protein DMF30_00225 [Verrucomicrobia bacterium]|nr:MAG: hypothetical protein DMF30_00225 [Verrucomicrobiota bacterium]